ncbi:polysaccharide biosynthesis tyrosine autokinase [Deinococcus cellulosilyticus]|uniref:ExoP n=1 Tax=Deinococcus cellulosilyticus (strain DSM 18568 / NBRC 106333 / KACC 11606 / 5516J-15) TaxID=1223518 RepID=A0A511N549_DEIC1|nr:polysaccharide biosynthesis tyrosine autokinase [Deinococcus cellulosilyticus]GEM47608.1 exoP [Deinococcus cellulosilyticus NBRC 106333 = KACC 11606]
MLEQTQNVRNDDIDIVKLFGTLRRNALLIGISVALTGGLTYFISKQQAPQYEAVSSVIAVKTDNGNSVINNTLVSAPPLPQGAVDKAIHSRTVVNNIITALEQSNLSASEKQLIIDDLNEELSRNSFSRLEVRAKLDVYLAGVYEITASAGSPQAASVLANAATQALLDWDVARGTARLKRAKSSLQQQLSAFDADIKRAQPGSIEQQTFISARANVYQNLAQIEVFEKAATGTLSLVSEAEDPSVPVSPRPVRNAALATLLALFLATGFALVSDALRKRIESDEDLTVYGVPVLGKLPKLNTKTLQRGIIESARSGMLYEAVGFLRVSLMSYTEGNKGARRLVVSSSRSGEGKSSVTAALAEGLASSGLKVLIIDLDLHRPTQHKVWSQIKPLGWHAMPGADNDTTTPARDVQTALINPKAAQALQVSQGIDMLPAGIPQRSAAHVINNAKLPELLDRWEKAYDVVLLDSPPILALADALTVSRFTQGILMVVEAHQTTSANVEATLKNIRTAGCHLVGFVLNKVTSRKDGYYYYYYSYRPEAEKVRKQS